MEHVFKKLFITPVLRMVTASKLTAHSLKSFCKTTTKSMADYLDEIIAFLLQSLTELEVVMQSVHFTNDLSLLEYCYRRFRVYSECTKVGYRKVLIIPASFCWH